MTCLDERGFEKNRQRLTSKRAKEGERERDGKEGKGRRGLKREMISKTYREKEKEKKKGRRASRRREGNPWIELAGRERQGGRGEGGREGPGNSRERRGHKKRLYHRNRRNGSSQLSAL